MIRAGEDVHGKGCCRRYALTLAAVSTSGIMMVAVAIARFLGSTSSLMWADTLCRQASGADTRGWCGVTGRRNML